MVKPGYKTSEFWFTLVSFIFSGLYLSGIITDNGQKEDLIQETSKGLEAIILVSGQLIVLYKYVKGRSDLKKTWWNTATPKEREEANKRNRGKKNDSKRPVKTNTRKINKSSKTTNTIS
jgi:hypothetical protein